MRPPWGLSSLYYRDSKYREQIKTHSCQILKGLIFDTWYSTKFVQIMALWSEWHRPGGHRDYEAVIVFFTLPLGAVDLYAVCACGIS